MVLIEKVWEDFMAGPDKDLGKLRKSVTLIQTHGIIFIIYDVFVLIVIFMD